MHNVKVIWDGSIIWTDTKPRDIIMIIFIMIIFIIMRWSLNLNMIIFVFDE